MTITWIKPLRLNIKEGELYKPSLVTYTKMNYFVRNNKVEGWLHFFYLNLWFFEIKHTWKTGVHE